MPDPAYELALRRAREIYRSNLAAGTTPDVARCVAPLPPAFREEAAATLREEASSYEPTPDDDDARNLPNVRGFRVVRRLGEGGQARVYEATRGAQRVALKIFRGRGAELRTALAAAESEAAALARLSDLALAEIVAVGLDGGFAYVATRFVDGRPLAADLHDWRAGAKGALAALIRLGAALARAHDAGVVHGDVSANNVIRCSDDFLVLIDFGMAQVDSVLGPSGGTPGFRAPEIEAGRPLDARADQYSFCRLVERTLRDVGGGSERAYWRKRLATALSRGCAPAPGDRYPSLVALLEDLRRVHAERPFAAPKPSRRERVRLWIRREPATAAVCGAAVLALLLTVVQIAHHVRTSAQIRRIAQLRTASEIERLIDAEPRLWPMTPDREPRFRRWLEAARAAIDAVRSEFDAARDDDAGERPADLGDDRLEAALSLESLLGPVEAAANGLPTFAALERDADAAWSRALAEIADPALCPAYGGRTVGRRQGLVPLGRNRGSGLYEFWVRDSGARPEVDVATGEPIPSVGCGVVLALIPAGEFLMGAQGRDPGRPNFVASASSSTEYPVRRVRVPPFFIGKWEITADQWRRWTGESPSPITPQSNYRTGVVTTLHPVDGLDQLSAIRGLRRVGLRLPSEAEWEYAARAEAVGVFDPRPPADGQFARDGETADVHRPIGLGAPNRFGLYDVFGNVWERCLDAHDRYPAEMTDARPRRNPAATNVVVRGGSYRTSRAEMRTTLRFSSRPHESARGMGVRPALSADEDWDAP